MERETFRAHFHDATVAARDFGGRFVSESLPEGARFRVHLNSSYDATASADFVLYPEDSTAEVALRTKDLDAEAVVDLLWRDGRVPQWIDIAISGEDGAATIFDLTVCGRFIADETRLYYFEGGIAPFGVKGPTLPVDWQEGTRFSIYDRSQCWSLEDLRRVERRARDVSSLSLYGGIFDDDVLGRLPAFPKLESLELDGTTAHGAGLGALANMPRLRHLRARLDAERFDFAAAPRCDDVSHVSLRGLPRTTRSLGAFVSRLASLRELALGSTEDVQEEQRVTLPDLDLLSLDLPRVPSWLEVSSVRWLMLAVPTATNDSVRALLARSREALDSLTLAGASVDDELLLALGEFPRLRYVDVAHTRVTKDALRRLAHGRPAFKCHPRVDD